MKKETKFYIILLMIITLFFSGCVSDGRDYKTISENADKAYLAEEYSFAITEYDALINKINTEGIDISNSDLADLYTLRGISKLNLEKYSDSTDDFKKALKLDPSFAMVHISLAQAYFNLDDKENMKFHLKLAKEAGLDIEEIFGDGSINLENSQSLEGNYNSLSSNQIDYVYENKEIIEEVEYQKEINGVVVGSFDELSTLIDTIQVKKVTTPNDEAKKAYDEIKNSEDYILDGEIYEIKSDKEGYLGKSLQIKLPLTEKLLESANDDNIGAMYLSVEGPIFVEGTLEGNFVVIQTGHLSSWWPTRKSVETQVNDFIKKKANEKVAAVRSDLSGMAIRSVDILLEKLGNRYGKKFDQEIFTKIMARKGEIDELIKSSAGKTSEAIAEDVNLYTAKLVLESMPDDSKVKFLQKITGNINILKSISTAAGTAAGGNYYSAVEVLGKALADEMPLTKNVKAVVNTYQAGIDMWQDHDFNSAYLAYTKGSKPGFFNLRHGVVAKDWEQLTTEYGRAIITSMKKKYPKIYDEEKLLKMAKKQFEQKEKDVAKLKVEEKRMKDIYAVWKKSNLRNEMSLYNSEKLYGDRFDRAKNFKFFLNRFDHAESDLKKVGYFFSSTRKGYFDPKVQKLLYALTVGGPEEYHKKLNEYKLKYQKEHKLSLFRESCDTNSDCLKGEICTEQKTCIVNLDYCSSYTDCGNEESCIENSCVKEKITKIIPKTKVKKEDVINYSSFAKTGVYTASLTDGITETFDFYVYPTEDNVQRVWGEFNSYSKNNKPLENDFTGEFDTKTNNLNGKITIMENRICDEQETLIDPSGCAYNTYYGVFKGKYNDGEFIGTWSYSLADESLSGPLAINFKHFEFLN